MGVLARSWLCRYRGDADGGRIYRLAAAMNGDSRIIRDVTEASFERDAISQSSTVPVVVDLWASWCAPCKALSPTLEKLALDYRGRVVLAKVDVDAEPRIAAAFQVQSTPSVFALIAGQPIPLFQGALPEPQVRAYIEELLKLAAENGVTGRLPDPGGLIRPIRQGAVHPEAAPHVPEVAVTGAPPPASDAQALRLFVSHSSEDGQAAVDVTAELGRRAVTTWLATRDIQVGENYAAQIYEAIVDCTHLLVLLSPSSVASAHVQREVNLALDQGKVILPIVVAPNADFMSTLPAQWKYWLGVVQVVPYTGPPDAVELLLRSAGSQL